MNRFCKILALTISAALFANAQISTDELAASPEKLYQYALGLYQRSFHEMALDSLNRYIDAYPDGKEYQDARVCKINCLQKLGRNAEMLSEIAAFRSQFPDSPFSDQVGILAADSLQSAKNYNDAIAFLDDLLKSSREATVEYAVFTKAKILVEQGKVAEAKPLFGQLAQKEFKASFPYRAYAASEYAFYLVQDKDAQAAFAIYGRLRDGKEVPAELREFAFFNQAKCQRMLQKNDQALAIVEKFIVEYPNSTCQQEARTMRILLTAEKQLYTQVIACCEDWNKRYPKANDCEVDYTFAFSLMQCKRFDEALTFFLRTISYKNCPQFFATNARYYSVYCQMMAGQHTVAVKSADEFLALYPKSTLVGNVLRWKGFSLEILKRLPEAEEAFRKAMSFFSESADEYENAGECLISVYVSQKKWKQAAATYRRMSQNKVLTSPEQFLLEAADMELRANDASAALEDLKNAAVSKDADVVESALIKMAETQFALRQYKEAAASYQALLKNADAERQAEIKCRIALCHFYLNDHALAKKMIGEALAGNVLQGEKRDYALFMLSRFHLAEKNYTEAIPALNELLKAPEDETDYIDASFLFMAADAYQSQNLHEPLLKVLQRIIALPDTAAENVVRARLRIVSDIMMPRNQFKPAVEQLKALLESLQDTGKMAYEKTVASSLLAEASLQLGQIDMATIYATQTLNSKENDDTTQARALYVRAFICLNNEKRYDAANQYATRCYIMMDHPYYSPRTMEISIKAFTALKNTKMADTVREELRSRYPAYYAQHQGI